MKLIVPKYYKDFKCIGGVCSDNCCIGWEIDIDGATLDKYRKTEGSLGERLKNNISENETPHFILRGERCPFLNSENLCDIITERGEGYLCDICREHPRYYTTLGDTIFGGVGMCCEAAAELILTEDAPHEYITLETDGEREECDEELLSIVLDLRDKIYEIFGDKTQSIIYTIKDVQTLAAKAQTELDGEPKNPCELKGKETDSLVSLFDKMEFMSDELPALLRKAENLKKPIFKNETVNKYLHNILAYFLDRYLPKAAEDGYILGKVAIATTSTLALARLFSNEENLTPKRAVYLAKLYSKEVEYNEDNIEKIAF